MILITSHLLIRHWRSEDAQDLIESANNKKIADCVRDRFPHPYAREHADHFINVFAKENYNRVFAIEHDN